MRTRMLLCVLFQLTVMCGASAVVYVDKSAPGGDGASWAAAFNTLQPALDAAYTRQEEVWVAAGDYDEARNVLSSGSSIEIDNGALFIPMGVSVYGGFAGDETQRDQRDWGLNETIVNGSAARLSGGPACHVIVMSQGVLDGFTVRGGMVTQFDTCINGGAGLFISGGDPIVRNCTIEDNAASGAGGALNASGCGGVFENCTFFNNGSNRGGAIVMSGCSTLFTKCRFQSNTCIGFRGYSGYGGVFDMSNSSPLFVNCVFWENTTMSAFSRASYGGAVNAASSSYPEFLNCTFYGNAAINEQPEYSSNYGGAIHSDASSMPVVINCILWGNVPDQVYGPALILNSDVQGGAGSEGCIDADPLFTDSLGRVASNSPCIGAASGDDAPLDDIRGVERPQGSGVDMGAYEMVYANASFSADVTGGIAPLAVQFTDLTPESGVTTWLWDLGDGTTSNDRHPAHTYAAAGVFTVSLTVTTIDGANTKTIDGYITVYGELQPAFSFDTNFGRRPLAVQFTDLSESPGPITGWQWQFGDGSRSTEQNPAHIYRVPGLFSVSLTVTAGPESATYTRHNAILVLNKRGATPLPWLIRWLLNLLR